MINKICDLALTAAYAANSHIIESSHLKAAASELIELQDVCRSSSVVDHIRRCRPVAVLAAVTALLTAVAVGFGAHGCLENGFQWQNFLKTRTAAVSKPDDLRSAHNSMPDQGTSELPPVSLSPHEIRAYILQLSSFNTLATTLRAK